MTIAEWRNAKGMTQKELAEALKTQQSSVSSWESGKTIPTKKTIEKIAAIFGCSPEELTISKACGSKKQAGELAQLIPVSWWDKYNSAHIGETVELLKTAYNAGFADGKRAP